MAHTHEFDCKVCGAHLDSRTELDQHNLKRHPEMRAASGQPYRAPDAPDPERDKTNRS
jgi:hypothetical protein